MKERASQLAGQRRSNRQPPLQLNTWAAHNATPQGSKHNSQYVINAFIYWRTQKGGGTKGGIWKCPLQPENPSKPPENNQNSFSQYATGRKVGIPVFHGTSLPMDFWTPPRFLTLILGKQVVWEGTNMAFADNDLVRVCMWGKSSQWRGSWLWFGLQSPSGSLDVFQGPR